MEELSVEGSHGTVETEGRAREIGDGGTLVGGITAGSDKGSTGAVGAQKKSGEISSSSSLGVSVDSPINGLVESSGETDTVVG